MRVWTCGHDNGNWLIDPAIECYCWCGVKAITEEEYEALQQSQQETHAGPDGYCTTCGGACKVIQRTFRKLIPHAQSAGIGIRSWATLAPYAQQRTY